MIDEQLFKDVMARIPSAVAVITTATDEGFRGVTVSSFCPLSLDPPLILACIDVNLQSHEILESAGAYTLNVLSRGQTFFAEQFSGQTPLADPVFERVPHRLGAAGVPMIIGAIAWIECRPWRRYDGGDHSIFIGLIESLAAGDEDDPLIYFNRGFAELSW